jgi:FtsP/CotA-like multicopper oxidase with cupredoxin domain
MANRGDLQNVDFSICDAPYDPSCVNETLTLDVEEEWTLTNNSNVGHPFHIHTNPFQLIRDGDLKYDPPYVWRDVVAIDTGTPVDLGKTVIRYVGREFTGEFVNHCHILGHEDRGMMHNVQMVCPNGDWGQPTSDLSPECREGNYVSAAPKCEEGTCDVSE